MSGNMRAEQSVAEFRNDVARELVRTGQGVKLSETAGKFLVGICDSESRFALISEVAVFLREVGEESLSLKWTQRLTEEFNEDIFAWAALAHWYLFADPPVEGSKAHLKKALAICEKMLVMAKTKNEFVRYVHFDICRVLRALGSLEQLESRMLEILADLKHERTVDCLLIEVDWLRDIPEDAIDPNLVARFKRLAEADRKRAKLLWPEARPATLSELEA